MKRTPHMSLWMALLTLILVIGVLAVPTSAAEVASGTCGDNVSWVLDDEGTLTISGTGPMYNWYTEDVKAPWYAIGYDIYEVDIKEGVTSIGRYAFYHCFDMVAITIPNSVTEIWDGAFSSCYYLRRVYYSGSQEQWDAISIHLDYNDVLFDADLHLNGSRPDIASGTCGDGMTWTLDANGTLLISGMGAMEDYAWDDTPWYSYRKSVKNVAINIGVTYIGEEAFYDCTRMESITIPESVTGIGARALWGCISLTSITLPDSITSIGSRALSACSSLESITLPKGITYIGFSVLSACSSLESITLPERVSVIDDYAFAYCTSLKSITISERVTAIGDYAFELCYMLEDVYYGGTEAQWKNLGDSRPDESEVRVHYECADAVNHWKEETRAATCVEAGYTREVCACDSPYIRNHVDAPATGNHIYNKEIAEEKYLLSAATCTAKAVYSKSCVCSKASDELTFNSGDLDTSNHTGTSQWTQTATTHEKRYTCCDGAVVESESHEWKAGSCTECGHSCTHADAEPKDHLCDYCKISIGDPHEVAVGEHNCDYCGKPASNCSDKEKDGDHNCDICRSPMDGYICKDTDSNHKCDECSKEISYCTDSDMNHKCDTCGADIGEHKDTDMDHECDYGCATTIGTCEDKNNDGMCDYGCGKEFEAEPTTPESTEPDPTEPDSTEPDAPETEGVTRLAGADRLVTSYLVADQLKQKMGVEKFKNIIVASGGTFADALPGSYLAAVKNAPIILTLAKQKYIDQTAAYIKANLVEGGTVYILGGESAVPASMEKALSGIKVQRVAGKDRFGTNLEILKVAGVKAGDEILVCTAKEFADSLSAAATGKPILLVYKKITDEQKEYLATLSGNTFCVVGGTSAVPENLEDAMKAYGEVSRLAGKDRLDTSVLVAEKYFPDATTSVVAYGWDFPDGLCGGSLAYALDAPLILTHSKEKLAQFTADYTTKAGIKDGFVLGGDSLVDDAATRAIFGMGTAPITLIQ